MTDRRSLILTEVASLLSGLTITLSNGVIAPGNFVRNRNDLTAEKVPGIILLDGDEVRDPSVPIPRQGRQMSMPPVMMTMTPEIYVVLDVRKPANIDVGQDLLIARQAIVSAVAQDTTLQQICGAEGKIVYNGVITDLARNREMKGQQGILISFFYPFIGGELIQG